MTIEITPLLAEWLRKMAYCVKNVKKGQKVDCIFASLENFILICIR